MKWPGHISEHQQLTVSSLYKFLLQNLNWRDGSHEQQVQPETFQFVKPQNIEENLLQVWVFLYMGQSPIRRAPTAGESCSSPPPHTTRQRTDVPPSPPVGRQASWRSARSKPRTPALKTMCPPSVRPVPTPLCAKCHKITCRTLSEITSNTFWCSFYI